MEDASSSSGKQRLHPPGFAEEQDAYLNFIKHGNLAIGAYDILEYVTFDVVNKHLILRFDISK